MTNAQLVNDYLAAFYAGDFDAAQALVADDFKFKVTLCRGGQQASLLRQRSPAEADRARPRSPSPVARRGRRMLGLRPAASNAARLRVGDAVPEVFEAVRPLAE